LPLHRRVLKLQLAFCLLWAAYALSYAPFVRYQEGATCSLQYRVPCVYRPVEWFSVQTQHLGSPLQIWACLCGAGEAVEMQTWFYTLGIDDPSEMDWHILQ